MAIVLELDVSTQTRVTIGNQKLQKWHMYMGRGWVEWLSAVTMLKKRETGYLELFSKLACLYIRCTLLHGEISWLSCQY